MSEDELDMEAAWGWWGGVVVRQGSLRQRAVRSKSPRRTALTPSKAVEAGARVLGPVRERPVGGREASDP